MGAQQAEWGGLPLMYNLLAQFRAAAVTGLPLCFAVAMQTCTLAPASDKHAAKEFFRLAAEGHCSMPVHRHHIHLQELLS